ncbi:unnamed protein product [Urochloa decumbens]|uniref:Leucine-rich repeat-containing N-terminal plant-type domain-containing protein n=1 Tax=Urochloa decumbens TaxID=240449 RepID=A0ABC8YYU7_9POAL
MPSNGRNNPRAVEHRNGRHIAVATMHRPAAMFALLIIACCFFLVTHAQLQPQPAASASCIPQERDALLAFKHGVTRDPAGLLNSWRRDDSHGKQDCCQWRGVRCSNRTGHVHKLQLRSTGGKALVGQISPSLLALKHLVYLDLSNNDLEGPTGRFPKFLGSLKSLKYLNLSRIQFHGNVPPHLGNLSKLQYLDLSHMRATNSTDLSWLTRLPSIQYLNLNGVNLSTVVNWARAMNMIPSLRVLGLSGCSLARANQSLPHLNLTNLEELDASLNSFNHPMVASWFWNITWLKYLNLGSTSLYGQIPDMLGGMTSLQVLDLSYNDDDDEKNMRTITTNLMNLCNLEVLNFHAALLYGGVTELFRNPCCSHNKLRELYLSFNHLTGILPKSIGQFTDLATLDISHNYLTGSVPYEIGMLTNLTSLYLNNNDLDGVMTEEHFARTRSLQYIDLSYNALKIELGSDWQPTFRLITAHFATCHMGPLFPGWLQWHVGITDLDISSAGIAGRLPQWFSDAFPNVERMNISNIQLSGGLPTNMSYTSLSELYLNSNQLTGQIPTMLPNLLILDLSNNFLSGLLPTKIGYANLIGLSLFSNRIGGHIPESFCKYQRLVGLDLSNNFLEGELPPCLGVMENMEFMALSNNSLSGEFPSFMKNYTSVIFLDLARNKFSGRLPIWIGKLKSLRILRLSHNKFFGNIPVNITNLDCLQYIDINSNEISGSLPSYLSNLKAMTKTHMARMCYAIGLDEYHLTSLSTVFKGHELDYGTISRALDTNMVSIDLSSNKLTGKIPEELIALDALVNLNLSWNRFSGVVPNKIGEMQSLESLDLSRNRLSGEIPTSVSNLTSLSYLDLSYNNLTGRIPSGTQLDTLYAANPSMYTGNIGLCGHPLPNNCSREGDTSKQGQPRRTEEGDGIKFFYIGLGCGFVVGTWVAFGGLLCKRTWRIAYFQLPDKLYDKVYVLVATSWARQPHTDYDEATAMVDSSTKFSQGMHE